MELTDEQAAVINASAHRVKVNAYAGTGKTTTMEEYARAHPNEEILYLAFNKSVQKEASGRFPRNTEIRTAHSLAFHEFGKPHTKDTADSELARSLDWAEMADVLDAGHDFDHVRAVNQTLTNFFRSSDNELHHDHIPGDDGSFGGANILGDAQELFERMIDPDDGSVPLLHDAYLTQYALSEPVLTEYDTILFDEAQDADPRIASIVRNQPARVIYVGDPYQQIYAWRGAINAMNQFNADDEYYLTNSFRFGPAVAELATGILEEYYQLDAPIRGAGGPSEFRETRKTTEKTVIHRSYASTFDTAAQATFEDEPVRWIGGIHNYNLEDLRDLSFLYHEQYHKIRNKTLADNYPNYEFYENVAEETDDFTMQRRCDVIEKYTGEPDDRNRIPGIINSMKKLADDDPDEVRLTVSTAHRAKGTEHSVMEMADDFRDLQDDDLDPGEKRDEVNLQYVTVTRGQDILDVPYRLRTMRARDRNCEPTLSQPPSSDESSDPSEEPVDWSSARSVEHQKELF